MQRARSSEKPPPKHHLGHTLKPEPSSPNRGVSGLDSLVRDFRLTSREEAVLGAIAAGLTAKETAARMDISPNTVKAYLRLIMSKMGVTTQSAISERLLEYQAELRGIRGLETTPLHPIIERAVAVIGDRVEAFRWLGSPVRALNFATPISILGTPDGAMRVADVLGQVEHGTW